MADWCRTCHFFVEKLLHEFIYIRGVKEQSLTGISRKAKRIIACQQHTRQQGPLVEKGGYMFIIAVGFKSRTGQQCWHQLFQTTEVVAVIIIVCLIKADYVVYFCPWCKAVQGGKSFIEILVVWL